VAQEVDANGQSDDERPRCEIDKIRKAEEACKWPGEVQLDGSLVCVRHAELLGLEDHSEAILGEVFEMDRWLESVDGRDDESRVGRAEQHRNDLAEQLRSNRTRMELIRDELLKDHEETT
jgi:hypothetical protein